MIEKGEDQAHPTPNFLANNSVRVGNQDQKGRPEEVGRGQENESRKGAKERRGREGPHPPTPAWNMVEPLSEAADVAKEIAAVGSGAFNHLCPESSQVSS